MKNSKYKSLSFPEFLTAFIHVDTNNTNDVVSFKLHLHYHQASLEKLININLT